MADDTSNTATPTEKATSFYEGLKKEYAHLVGLVEHVEGVVRNATEKRVKDVEEALGKVEAELGLTPGTHIDSLKVAEDVAKVAATVAAKA